MSFFKLHKPLVYKYKPIYYDPKKEAQKDRMRKMEQEGQAEVKKEGYEPKVLRRDSFREMADKNRNSKHAQTRQSNIRLVIIILILLLIAYFLVR
jgi:integrase